MGGVSQKVSQLWSISTLNTTPGEGMPGDPEAGELEEVRDCYWVVGQVSRLHQRWMNQQGGVVQRYQEGISYGPERGSQVIETEISSGSRGSSTLPAFLLPTEHGSHSVVPNSLQPHGL